jgi:hypothetical protein
VWCGKDLERYMHKTEHWIAGQFLLAERQNMALVHDILTSELTN